MRLIANAAGTALLGLLAGCAPHYDLLIVDGLVVDGTGRAGHEADVAVSDGKIVFIGDAEQASAGKVIDASGLVVSPGFIDVHNHVPGSLPDTADWTNAAYTTQGVTTVVGGPDGSMNPEEIRREHERLQARGFGTNYAFYVGHNAIRSSVMGHAARAPSADELERMKAQVRDGMEFGTLGLSTGLMYEPGMFSDTSEVIALAKEVAPYDGIYDSHTRNPVYDLLGSDREVIEIGRAAGIEVRIGHEKAVGLINKGRISEVIELVEQARSSGLAVYTDQYPYDGAATATLESLIVSPELARRYTSDRDPERREHVHRLLETAEDIDRLKEYSENGIDGGFSWIKAVGYGSVRIVDAPRQDLVGRNIELYARELDKHPFEVVVDLIKAYPGQILATLGAIDEADVRELLVQPWNMIGSDGHWVSDGDGLRRHPRSTGSFTKVLGHYTRDLGLLSLPEAIRKMTSLPAAHLRLFDRGRLESGYVADVVVFDASRIRARSTWTDPHALSEGMIHVLVNGVPVIENEEVTGARPGTFVRRQTSKSR